MKRLSEEEKEEERRMFSEGIALSKINRLEFMYEYVRRVRPFNLNTYVTGFSSGLKICGCVEAYSVDDNGYLTMILAVDKFKESEYILCVKPEDVKTFKEVLF